MQVIHNDGTVISQQEVPSLNLCGVCRCVCVCVRVRPTMDWQPVRGVFPAYAGDKQTPAILLGLKRVR